MIPWQKSDLSILLFPTFLSFRSGNWPFNFWLSCLDSGGPALQRHSVFYFGSRRIYVLETDDREGSYSFTFVLRFRGFFWSCSLAWSRRI